MSRFSPATRWLPVLLCTVMLATGCTSSSHRVPVSSAGERSDVAGNRYHLVRKGETLYSIAWGYGLDYRDLAAANGIGAPYTIYVDQRLSLPGAGTKRTRATVKAPPAAAPTAPRTTASLPKSAPSARAGSGSVKWHWPLEGRILRAFARGEGKSNGIDIEGRPGQKVASAADGIVVYAGGGLRGYGKLIIVKHNDTYLSAYGHNRVLLVNEGEAVKGGQVVAEVGANGAEQEMLHFEIRRNGKPEDPLKYLPGK